MNFVKKNITVTEQQEAFIQTQLATGRYASDSEVIQAALREKEQRLAELERVRGRLVSSEQSGISDRTPEDIRAAVKCQLKA